MDEHFIDDIAKNQTLLTTYFDYDILLDIFNSKEIVSARSKHSNRNLNNVCI